MAEVRQLGWKTIPAVRSGYDADTLPDQYRSTYSSRLVRTAELLDRLHDRCRRTCNSFSLDRRHEALAYYREGDR